MKTNTELLAENEQLRKEAEMWKRCFELQNEVMFWTTWNLDTHSWVAEKCRPMCAELEQLYEQLNYVPPKEYK